MYSSNKTTDSSRSPSPNGVGSLQENNVTKRAVLSMIANNEYRCVKLFMEIEEKKWESASLYEEYFILNWMKTDYDSISATLTTNNFISGAANYTTHPCIEYFTSKKMDELRKRIRDLIDKMDKNDVGDILKNRGENLKNQF